MGKKTTQTTLCQHPRCSQNIYHPSYRNTSEVHSIKALLDSRAMGNFIDKDFVHMKGISIWSISRPILVYNIDGSPNKAGQISKAVDVVLHYKTHSGRTLLAVSSLRKQSMILSYTWLKDHNPEVNWQTEGVQINWCPPRCEGCCVIQKEQVSQKKMDPFQSMQKTQKRTRPLSELANVNMSKGTDSLWEESSWSLLQRTYVPPLQSPRSLRKEPVKPWKHRKDFSPCLTVPKVSNPCSQRKTSISSWSTGSKIMLLSSFQAQSLSHPRSTLCLQ